MPAGRQVTRSRSGGPGAERPPARGRDGGDPPERPLRRGPAPLGGARPPGGVGAGGVQRPLRPHRPPAAALPRVEGRSAGPGPPDPRGSPGVPSGGTPGPGLRAHRSAAGGPGPPSPRSRVLPPREGYVDHRSRGQDQHPARPRSGSADRDRRLGGGGGGGRAGGGDRRPDARLGGGPHPSEKRRTRCRNRRSVGDEEAKRWPFRPRPAEVGAWRPCRPRRAMGSAEANGLYTLMLHCEARRGAQRDESGAFVPLEAQDPSRWDPTRATPRSAPSWVSPRPGAASGEVKRH